MVPYLLILHSDKKTYIFKENDPNEIINNFIEKLIRMKIHVVFFHVLNFDGSIIINYLINDDITIKIISHERAIYTIKIYKKKIEITLKCSFRFMPFKLEKIAIDFGLEEKKIKIKHDKITYKSLYLKGNSSKKLIEKMVHYCKNDVIMLLKALTYFNNEVIKWKINIINMKKNVYSISAISLRIYEDFFNKKKLMYENEKFYEKISSAYSGGRCEVFGNKKKNEIVRHYDFRSMYPNCMRGVYPTDMGTLVINPKEIKFGIYEIEYQCKMEIPVLGYKYKNKLVFPNTKENGVLKGKYFSEEINLHIKMGGKVIKINWGIEYEELSKTFEEFVDNFLEKRKESPISNKIYKLILNSLYGKYGSKEKKIKLIAKIKNKSFEITTTENKENYINKNVIICAITTARARIKLYESFVETKKSGGRVLYCDTDSIFAAFEKKSKNESKIPWDDNIIKNSLFLLPKVYFIGAKQIVKGVRDLKFNIKKIFLEKKKVKLNQWRIRYKKGYPNYEKYEKTIKDDYNKRIWNDKNKIKTKPLTLEEL